MEKKPTTDHAMANGGYRPITEGYQPGSQLIRKGAAVHASHQPPPPKGGSGAMKPDRAPSSKK